MNPFKAGLYTMLALSVLATGLLTWFGQSYAGYDLGAVITRIVFWGPVTLVCAAPISLIAFPAMHLLLGRIEPVRARNFAFVGAGLGLAISIFLVWRFRSFLLQASFLAAPFLVGIGLITGFVGGFIFEILARVRTVRPNDTV